MSNTKTIDKDKEKIQVKIRHNLSVMIDPKKNTPEYIEYLRKKYENCTGKTHADFW